MSKDKVLDRTFPCPNIQYRIQDVTPRMRTNCCVCGNPPGTKRFAVIKGQGRFIKTNVFCMKCVKPAWEEIQKRWDTFRKCVDSLVHLEE